jgi:peptidoglycan/xylan/chitin deacetylase (PgdA/CDA1 family)
MPDPVNFMSWTDIAELHAMGFEIGNHSWTHADFSTPRGAARLEGELALVDYELSRVKVPKPTSFAWCGNYLRPESIAVLRRSGITLARRGGAPEVEYGKVVVGPAYRSEASSSSVNSHHRRRLSGLDLRAFRQGPRRSP